MSEEVSKSQIDRLGDRLREGSVDESDSRLLDHYRLSFTEAYEFVVGTVRKELGLNPTGRPAKSTTSISEKLRRESIRLTQIQDIAGCRLVVADIIEQDRTVESLSERFAGTVIVDRREKPSHGYRAVHVIASCEDKLVEVQVRTSLQHLWAELSEKLSDLVNPSIKYGGGDESMQRSLLGISESVAYAESRQKGLAEMSGQVPSLDLLPETLRQQIATQEESVRAMNRALLDALRALYDGLSKLERK